MNPRIRIMLDSRHIEERAPAHGEVEGMWAKAVGTWQSSEIEGLNPDARFTLAYQAALQASTAVIRAAGYQTRGEAHHQHTFAAVSALAIPELSQGARKLNKIRQMRHGAIYDWETRLTKEDADEVRAATRQLMFQAQAWLRSEYPKLELLPTSPP